METLEINNQQLYILPDISGIIHLDCSNNFIEEIDLRNTKIKTLICNNNNIKKIYLPKHTVSIVHDRTDIDFVKHDISKKLYYNIEEIKTIYQDYNKHNAQNLLNNEKQISLNDYLDFIII
jgi:hypothetical protein